jgi:molybdopterin molybdotransferase
MDSSPPLRSVEAAQRELLQHFHPLSIEHVPLAAALGRTLAADVRSDSDVPPFANSAMDGYAVLAADIVSAAATTPATLAIIERLAAGAVALRAVEPGSAIRIMTGAPLPAGADTVVPFEDTDEMHTRNPNATAVQIYVANAVGANIRPAGEDMLAGATVLTVGTPITPGVIGVLATVGVGQVPVFRRPRVAILATGDELVEVDQTPGPGQIRNSNGYANAAQVLAAGGEPLMLPIARDTEADLIAIIEQGLAAGVDLFLTSGGVSVGDYDVVKQVLESLGRMEFWRVRMRPGKPVAFGHLRGVPLIGLPGNPVSAMVCFELFARPALLKMQGRQAIHRPTVYARFAGEPLSRGDRRQYMRVVVRPTGGGFVASSTGGQGSGLITSMARANGLLVIEEGSGSVPAESNLPVLVLEWAEAEGSANE